jgi:hypothetical protein
MRRALPAALLVALTVAAPAAAAPRQPPPFVKGSLVSRHSPIRAITVVTPPVQLFGNTLKATVTVLADRKFVDPSRIRVVARFTPYSAVGPPTVSVTENRRVAQLKWTWTLNCLVVGCVPIVPPSDLAHVFHFPPARIEYVDAKDKVDWAVGARFPGVEALSQISPGIAAYLRNNERLKWEYQLAPETHYRVAPAEVFWLAIVLACVCALTGIAVAVRWALRLRSPAAARYSGPPPSSLERALALFFWAGGRGDETLQRKALERVAAELPFDVLDLSEATRELAWSPEAPREDDVEELSERAGVPAHHENGTGA